MRVGKVAKEYTEWSVLDNDIDFKAAAGGTKELPLIRNHSGALGTVRDRLCLYIDCGYKSRLPNQNFVFVTALFKPRNHWVLCACNSYRCHGGCWYTPGHRLMGFLRSTVTKRMKRRRKTGGGYASWNVSIVGKEGMAKKKFNYETLDMFNLLISKGE